MRKQLLFRIVPAALVGLSSSSGIAQAGVANVASAGVTSATVAQPNFAQKSAMGVSLVDAALRAVTSSVSRMSHPAALRMAFQAYYNFKAAHPELVRNPFFYFVDYGLSTHTPRGYVFDMSQQKIVDGPFIVAAGRGSAQNAQGVPTRFSNAPSSGATSLGLYVAQGSYSFTGHAGGRLYSSIGLRLNGVSGSFNNRALQRGVVVHGAPYVTPSGAGRSKGCPAMDQTRAHQLIPKLANGGLVFLFSPNDRQWMQTDPWAAAAGS